MLLVDGPQLGGIVVRATTRGRDYDDVIDLFAHHVEADGLPHVHDRQFVLGDFTHLLVLRILRGRIKVGSCVRQQLVNSRVFVETPGYPIAANRVGVI